VSGSEVSTPAVEGTAVVRTLERQLAVSHWLLGAADDRDLARSQWQEAGGVALLACGGIFSAVRAPAHLVWAAAGSEDLATVDDHLRRWLDGGAVFMDLYLTMYYFLVPSSTAWKWSERDYPGVACLGRDHYLGVPALCLTERRGRSYWCVPMDHPGDLCYVDEVEQLLKEGRAARGEGGVR
jgi:hypothetical protein